MRVSTEFVNQFQNGTKVLGVTVWTTLSDKESKKQFDGRSASEQVLFLARNAKKTGCAGAVCSGREVENVKQAVGSDFIVVTPGIRPSWSSIPKDDQQRVTTPEQAILNGADYIVVGRPIALDKDPVGAADRISEEIARALEQRK